ncbi:MAG: ComEC/Rec2 family competence protein [Lachnospiraceae bacterium]|nr:ComEC/Rec2 family competence protein [Lachnospiraceae bacterium]
MKRPLCTGCLFFLVLVWLGLRWLGPPDNPCEDHAGETVQVSGEVDWKEEKNGNQVFYLKNVSFSDRNYQKMQENSMGRIGVVCYPDEGVLPPLGARIIVSGRLSLYRKAGNPGEFDTYAYYLYKGYGARITVQEWSLREDRYNAWKEGLWQLRHFLGQIYEACLPPEDAGVMKAMVLGDKGDLSSDIRELYRVNGIAHILAISGLHISILGMGLYKGLRRLTLPVFPAAGAALFAMVNYAVLSGASTSTVRAVVMFGLMAGADVERRSYDLPTALALSAASTVFFAPYELMLSAFWMSYLAVFGIAVYFPALLEGIRFCGKHREKVIRTVGGSIAVTAFTLPVILLVYYETPVYSVLLNLLVIPLMSVLMVFGLLTLLLGSLSLPLGIFAALPCHYILTLYSTLCSLLQRLPMHTCIAGCPGAWNVAVSYLLFCSVLLLRSRQLCRLARSLRKKGRESGAAGQMLRVLCGAGIFGEKQETAMGRLLAWRIAFSILAVLFLLLRFHPQIRITVLDVGQGDGICFESADLTVMIDGGSTTKDDLYRYQLEPFLKYEGISRIDYWLITHPDRDHCSGLIEMLSGDMGGIRVGALVLPDAAGAAEDCAEMIMLAQARGIPVQWNAAGEVIRGGTLRFLCLHPSKGYVTEDVNSYSQVVEVSGGGFSGLFTGDATVESEEALLRGLSETGLQKELSRPYAGYFCLKLGHHGSHTSSSQAFLDFAAPQVAVVSCGYHNSYGHPHADVMERVEAMGCDIFRTDTQGAVTIRVNGERISVEHFLE